MQVRRGQEVYFSASCKMHWGKNRNEGPGGERNSPRNPDRPIPERAGGAEGDAKGILAAADSGDF